MLGNHEVMPTLAVRDLERAKAFYGGTLGLEAGTSLEPGAMIYRSGGCNILVYESAFAGTNEATAASWVAGDDFDAVVDHLRSKGVTFEHYDDLPGTTREGDVHTMGPMRGVWFKDPDGNILSIGSGA